MTQQHTGQGSALRVFLCHCSDDRQAVRSLYARLKADGFAPWLDEENILPGQDWDSAIRRAVRDTHIVIVCLSTSSITKEGYIQKEIKFALDVADEKPGGAIFLIPARIVSCEVPERLRRWQWVNLFESNGYERLVSALRSRKEEVDRSHASDIASRHDARPADEVGRHIGGSSRPPSSEALRSRLCELVVGQNEAVEAIVGLYEGYLAGMREPGRTLGNSLFLGPTGSGKTRIVEATAETLFQTSHAVLRIDCAEFQHSHEVAKLIGSPPGYLGHATDPLLTQEVLDSYHTAAVKFGILLFDEIEKASDALWNLLLAILDKATLTLGNNRRVNLSKTLIFLTSNLGADEIMQLLKGDMGFSRRKDEAAGVLDRKVVRAAMGAAQRKFSPEFMNRLDKIIVFKPLGPQELSKVLDIELKRVQERVFLQWGQQSFAFTTSDAAKAYLLREGTDMRYGARHLKRAIERLLIQPLSHQMVVEQLRGGDYIRVDFNDQSTHLAFHKEAEHLSLEEMMKLAGRGGTS